MKLQEAIDQRHSIREYEKKKVPLKVLKNLIKNAGKAPSGQNEQPWNFYIINSSKVRGEIIQELKKLLKDPALTSQINKLTPQLKKIAISFYENLGDAPNIIFVYRNKKEKDPRYQYFNDIAGISASIENLMLSAVEEELGTCWVGTFYGIRNQLRKLLKIPKNQEYVTALLIGYPKKGYKPLKRKMKKLNEIMKLI